MEPNLKNSLLVFFGGGIGSVVRYIISLKLDHNLPYGTFLVNIFGCLIIGIICGLFEKELINNSTRIFWVAGFCGGFTTFSSLILQKYQMILKGEYLYLVAYILLSMLIGFVAVATGFKMSKATI